MLKRLSVHMRSNVVAYLALFLALGGVGAYAADKITSKDIAKNAVKSKHVKNDNLKSKDVKDGNLTGADLADGAVGTADLANGSVTGAKIAAGVLPNTGVVARRVVQEDIGDNAQSEDSVQCEAGEHAVGGGAAFITSTDQYDFPSTLHASVPLGSDNLVVGDGEVPTGWRASALNDTGATRDFAVIVLCQR